DPVARPRPAAGLRVSSCSMASAASRALSSGPDVMTTSTGYLSFSWNGRVRARLQPTDLAGSGPRRPRTWQGGQDVSSCPPVRLARTSLVRDGLLQRAAGGDLDAVAGGGLDLGAGLRVAAGARGPRDTPDGPRAR